MGFPGTPRQPELAKIKNITFTQGSLLFPKIEFFIKGDI